MADSNKKNRESLRSVKSSLWSRSMTFAKIGISTGSQWAAQGVLGLLEEKAKKDQRWQDFLKDQAGRLATELGRLKGSAMKAGQMLSMYGEYFLPPEANEFLKTLQSQSPPLNWEAVEPLILSALGSEKMKELEIDRESIGSASLGQVHRARVRATGEWIALKIQYPGVEKAIDSDLKTLRAMLSIMKLLPTGVSTDVLFEEVRMLLHQEIDYRQEADLTEAYQTKLGEDSRYIIPKVVRRYCGDKIIATSFEDGFNADASEVQNLPLERRNRLAQNFLELYLKEVFVWGSVQTDPHLGNYKIRIRSDGKDQIVCLDFGAVRTYEEKFLKPYRQMARASHWKKSDELIAAAQELGFLVEGDDPTLVQRFLEFCFLTTEPFNDQDYDWKKSDLPKRLSRKVFEMVKNYPLRTPPKEALFIDRKTGGVFIFLTVLGANLNSRKLFEKYLQISN